MGPCVVAGTSPAPSPTGCELLSDDVMQPAESGERGEATACDFLVPIDEDVCAGEDDARAETMEILGLDDFDLEMPSFAHATLCTPVKSIDPLQQDKQVRLAKVFVLLVWFRAASWQNTKSCCF